NFEANPASLTKEKVETLKRIGFNRISLGIQSTDKRVLKTENRLNQDFEKTKKISKEIIDNNFIFNTDLIMGLKEDTPEAFLNSFKNAISLHPDLITLYKLRPTKAYAKCDDSTETLYNHHHFILNSTFGEIERLAELNNYKKVDGPESGDGFFYVKKQSIDNLRNIRPLETYGFEPISTFGVGAFAVSGVGYSLLYRNNSDLTFNSENESYEVLETDSTPASLRYILDTISRNYSLDINKFNEYFNFDIYIKYGVEIKFLERMGKIVKTKTKINFSFNSLKEKFFYMLLFLENGQLLDLIKNEKERP
ncbi:MAG: radical SAM protein, partial [Candidatus Peregrinibacteria bacterium]|nr:radical SAM protein [Candidatus Peregrinibacteria bacterium]